MIPLSTILRRNQKCDFLKKTVTGTGTGAQLPTWPTALALGVPCWKQGLSSKLRTEFIARKLEVTEVVYCPENPGVTEGDCIRIGTNRYLILAVDNEAGMDLLYRYAIRAM